MQRGYRASPALIVTVVVEGRPIEAIVDTGAEATLISEELYDSLDKS